MVNAVLNITNTYRDIILKKRVIVLESSDEEVKQGRKRKRKSTTNMDKINKIPKKQIKAKTAIYPTRTLLA